MAVVLLGCAEQIGVAAGSGVQPTKATFARLGAHHRQQCGRRIHDVLADMHLTVIGGDNKRCAGGKNRQHIADEGIDRSELGIVELAEAALVSDLVDAVVIGVDESLASVELTANLDSDA